MMEKTPTQAIHFKRPSVWILDSAKATIAATTTNTAVQVPWDEREFSPIEMPSIPAPATNTKPKQFYQYVGYSVSTRLLTETEANTQGFATDRAEHEIARIVDTIDIRVAKLELSDHPATPSSNSTNDQQADDTWYEAKNIKG